ncbi:MAG: hypothetical protein RSB02_06305, partial [Anaerovoracaceae bacterium]
KAAGDFYPHIDRNRKAKAQNGISLAISGFGARLLPAFANTTSWHAFCARKLSRRKSRFRFGTAFAPKHRRRATATTALVRLLLKNRAKSTLKLGMAFAPKSS